MSPIRAVSSHELALDAVRCRTSQLGKTFDPSTVPCVIAVLFPRWSRSVWFLLVFILFFLAGYKPRKIKNIVEAERQAVLPSWVEEGEFSCYLSVGVSPIGCDRVDDSPWRHRCGRSLCSDDWAAHPVTLLSFVPNLCNRCTFLSISNHGPCEAVIKYIRLE